MVAEAHVVTHAEINYFNIPPSFHKKTSTKVGHPNMMAVYFGAHTSQKKSLVWKVKYSDDLSWLEAVIAWCDKCNLDFLNGWVYTYRLQPTLNYEM